MDTMGFAERLAAAASTAVLAAVIASYGIGVEPHPILRGAALASAAAVAVGFAGGRRWAWRVAACVVAAGFIVSLARMLVDFSLLYVAGEAAADVYRDAAIMDVAGLVVSKVFAEFLLDKGVREWFGVGEESLPDFLGWVTGIEQ